MLTVQGNLLTMNAQVAAGKDRLTELRNALLKAAPLLTDGSHSFVAGQGADFLMSWIANDRYYGKVRVPNTKDTVIWNEIYQIMKDVHAARAILARDIWIKRVGGDIPLQMQALLKVFDITKYLTAKTLAEKFPAQLDQMALQTIATGNGLFEAANVKSIKCGVCGTGPMFDLSLFRQNPLRTLHSADKTSLALVSEFSKASNKQEVVHTPCLSRKCKRCEGILFHIPVPQNLLKKLPQQNPGTGPSLAALESICASCHYGLAAWEPPVPTVRTFRAFSRQEK